MRILLFLFIFLIVLTNCQKTTPPTRVPGLHKAKIEFDGIKRNYLFYIPKNEQSDKKSPLVIFLHGFIQTAEESEELAAPVIHPLADTSNAIIVYPNAVEKHWNDELGGSYLPTDGINDTGFLTNLIDYFIKNYNCDEDRIYLMGVSNGGSMVYRLSCMMPHRLAAIAIFISNPSEVFVKKCAGAEPLPIIITNGTADTVMKWNGGKVGFPFRPILYSIPNDENLEYWKKRNGITQPPDSFWLPDFCPGDDSRVVRYSYHGKSDLEFYKVINGGHNIPFKSYGPTGKWQNCDYYAMDDAWRFLLRHKRK